MTAGINTWKIVIVLSVLTVFFLHALINKYWTAQLSGGVPAPYPPDATETGICPGSASLLCKLKQHHVCCCLFSYYHFCTCCPGTARKL